MRSNEVNVSITINGKNVENLQMKLGQSGEAYFVVPTNKPLQHKKLLTSPLITPQSANKSQPPPQQSIAENAQMTIPNSPIKESNNEPSAEFAQVPQLNLSQVMSPNRSEIEKDPYPQPLLEVSKKENEIKSVVHFDEDGNEQKHENAIDDNAPLLSPTLSATSSFLEDDREVLSRLNIDTSTGTDNDSLTGTDNETNLESLDGGDLFANFSATHVMIEHIGMSLCAHKLKPDSEENNMKMFEEHKISYAQFCENPSLCFDANLIILYKGQLFPAKIAFPQIFSLLSFGTALSSKAIKKLNKDNHKQTIRQVLDRNLNREL